MADSPCRINTTPPPTHQRVEPLMWVLGCRSSFEPRRRQDPTDGRFARKPTTVVAGHSGDTPVGILDATNPSRRASHPPSGHYVLEASALVDVAVVEATDKC